MLKQRQGSVEQFFYCDAIFVFRNVGSPNIIAPLFARRPSAILADLRRYRRRIRARSTVVPISPDLGDRYVETFYNNQWVVERLSADSGSRYGTPSAAAAWYLIVRRWPLRSIGARVRGPHKG